jgi:hypothetical protein
MELHESITVSGRVTAHVIDHTTGEEYDLHEHNLVTNTGLNVIADLLSQRPGAIGITHISVGTGTTPPTAADIALEAEVYRGQVTRANRSTIGTADFEYYLQRASANVDADGKKLYEVGLWAGDRLYARALFPAGVPKSQNYSVILSWASAVKPEVVS